MYLPGHDVILNDVFKHIKMDKKLDMKSLQKGLYYPDLPCGKYTIVDDKYVFMTSKNVCNLFNLIQLYDPKNNEFYEIFQSHKGILAYLHSMTPNPSFTVRDVRDTILIQICGYFLLALFDDNLWQPKPEKKPETFWLGAILHIIMDSYSPAHAIRTDLKQSLAPPRSPYTPSRIMRKRIRDVILDRIKEEFAEKTLDSFDKFHTTLANQFIDDKTAIAFIKEHKEQLYNSYLSFSFDIQMQKKAKSYLGAFSNYPTTASSRGKYDIRNFMYYNNQTNFYHQRKDFLFNLTKYPKMYDRMIEDCRFVVEVFVETLNSTGSIKPYFAKLCTYLLENTYRICKDDLDSYTGILNME